MISRILMIYCWFSLISSIIADHLPSEHFKLKYKWKYANYTWVSADQYENAVKNSSYIPYNNEINGMKIFKDKIFFAIPALKPGIPVTLAYNFKNRTKLGLLRPYPNWESNKNPNNCSTLQSVLSMAIDSNGIMWVIDGIQDHEPIPCPPKLVLLDLENNGIIKQIYYFPEKICSSKTCFLNDIVLEETENNTYAYITNSDITDPSLIVYSKKRNSSWIFRDRSMYAEIENADYILNGSVRHQLEPINGIALSPKAAKDKYVYFCSRTGLNLYQLSTDILKNNTKRFDDQWRRNVKNLGKKEGQSDGLIMDNKGNLFYTLQPQSAMGIWNTKEPFANKRIIEQNCTIRIPNALSFDDENRSLYVLGDRVLLTLYTNSRSYLRDPN